MSTSHKPQRASTPTKKNGENYKEDKLTTSNYQKIITETGTSRGNIKSSVHKSTVMVTQLKIKDNEQTILNSTTTSSETSSNEKPLPNNETQMVDSRLSTIFEYSKEHDKSTTNKYGEETKSSETSNGDKNNNELTSKITNSMSEHIRTSLTTKPNDNIKISDAEIKLTTTTVNKNKMTQKEQSSSNKGTIEDHTKGNKEKSRTSNTKNNDHITKISQTRDSRLTSSAENIVISKSISEHSSTVHLEITPREIEFESTVEINGFKTSLRQGSTNEIELSQTTEFAKTNLSKLTQPSTIDGTNHNNPENTKGNSDTGGETTDIAKAPEIDNDIRLTKFELHSTKDVNPGKTTDSRLTSSAENIVTSKPIYEHSSTFHLEITPSENEFESTVEINGFMPKRTSLRQSSTKEKELSQTTDITNESLSKRTRQSTIEGTNPNNPENTEGNSNTGGETTNITKAPEIDNDTKVTKFELHSTKDANPGKTYVETYNTDKLTVTTKVSGIRHDEKQVETTDRTEDKIKTTKETDSKETSPNQPTDIMELIVSPERPKGQITQLNSNSYFTSALNKVIQSQAADENTDYDKNTQISTSFTFDTKTKTWKAGETTTKDHTSEQNKETMGLMNTNKVSEESVTPNKQASTKITKLISENEQTEKSKQSTMEGNKETLDIGYDAKTFGIDQDPTSTATSTLTTPCVCPTASSLSPSTQSTTPGILTTSGSCFCPDITPSTVEEETSTNMPEMKGRRRRRKEISEMDLYVDNFDQKIMKKMPFLKSY